ncbi:hypothetical protein SAMN05216371_1604 [Streptomyces sp. TLI_053]|uniref:hypothetical protein n=1 Tax=Streptomyces sp. TLI_053 TaxID=1855352 RepID=UPI00087C0846|nr:hypothetical protein [Streptomyces sp. TLI_053]SDT23072.1 hypothetical protein SAMN05216371_1604 [Streptomyces sp. TLI_053]
MPTARRRRRLPDEVRTAVVRAVLCLAFTLVGIVVAALSSYADSWLMTPALMAMGLGVFGTMWCLLEILISRQVAAQRVRAPNSASPMGGSHAPAGPPQYRQPPRARPPYPQQPQQPQQPQAQPQRPGTQPPPYPGGPGPRQAGATTR